MKTLRITATLLLTLVAAACTGSPMGPAASTSDAVILQADGQGLLGGGTMAP